MKLNDSDNLKSSDLPDLLQCSNDHLSTSMDEFTSCVSKLLEVISTLAQFSKLINEKKLRGLPRFAELWNLKLRYECEGKADGDASMDQSFKKGKSTAKWN